MKSPDYWFDELLKLMGEKPGDDNEFGKTEEGKKHIALFKEYVGRIQEDARLDLISNQKEDV